METTIAVLGGLVAGGMGGFVLSLLGWLDSGQTFDVRKNIAAIITSTFTGLIATVALVQTDIFTNPKTPDWQLIVAFITIFGASAGFGSMGRKAAGAAQDNTAQPAAAAETKPPA